MFSKTSIEPKEPSTTAASHNRPRGKGNTSSTHAWTGKSVVDHNLVSRDSDGALQTEKKISEFNSRTLISLFQSLERNSVQPADEVQDKNGKVKRFTNYT